MKLQKNVLQLVSLNLFIGTLVACSDVRLSPLGKNEVNIQSVGDFCTKSPSEVNRYTKFMFVMDKSGSNTSTDPNANKRAGSLERFYEANKDKEFLKWGLITFQSPGTQARIGGAQDPIFTDGDDPQVSAAIATLRAGDNGNTPYSEALTLTQKAIQTDLETYSDEDNTYMVFFVSDGQPTGVTSESALRAAVKNIIDLSPGKVFLSTGFYSANGSGGGNAVSLLSAMAEEGNGKFVNFQATDDFDFNGLIVEGPTKEPWQIKNFIVYNLNSSICEDGSFDVDSDGDGLCDRDEIKYGLDPQRRFSMPGGFGDYFIWRTKVFGEKLPVCNDRSDEDHDMLTLCEEAYIFNQTPISPSPDIEIPQRGDSKNPDTDLDGFLDGIEVFSFRDKSSPMNARDVLTSFDSEEDAGTQIKKHRNPMKWDPQYTDYDTRILPRAVVPETQQTCYSFSQTRLLVYETLEIKPIDNFPDLVHAKGENVVYTHFIQVPQREPLGRGILMYSFQKLKRRSQAVTDSLGYGAGLKINDAVFKDYVVPKK